MAILSPGNTCCITGGASGIGLATAERCARAGMNVCLADVELFCDERAATLAATLEAAGAASVLALECDVSSLESMERVQSAVFGKFGGCHFLSLNAGIGGGGGVLASEDRWRALIDVSSHAICRLRVHGSILADCLRVALCHIACGPGMF